MKNLFLLAFALTITIASTAQQNPLNIETYKLKNGLTVYLNVDKSMPMVHGMVVVKGGAKRDPKNATGIAHYFEHIMFKGTNEIGTVDYTNEKVYLDSIAILYDSLATTNDANIRLNIQKEINRISVKAAEFAIPNEVDKILNGMGGKNINAGTNYEYITYYNSFPANQIEKWLEVYCHRFENPVFRLFQSELETVYEEKNMYADDAINTMFEDFSRCFYKNSPYGQQLIIGSKEHLKNPSLSKMNDYFKTYYVANNMALILAGDFDPAFVKPIIEDKYGKWRMGDLPEFEEFKEIEFTGKEVINKRMTPVKVGLMGFRTVPKNHPDELAIEFCSNLLGNNNSTGLLDQLRDDNKIMFAGLMNDFHTELGGSFLIYVPKIVGQTLKSAEKEVNKQLELLKTGNFSDELFQGVKTEMQKESEKDLEDMRWRTYAIMNTFVYNENWDNLIAKPEKINNITKAEIVAAANKYFNTNCLVYHSKMGFPKKDKIDKPPFDPIKAMNGEKKSAYAKKIEAMPVVDLPPQFIDFKNDITITDLTDNIKIFTTPNPINKLFSIKLVYNKGYFEDALVTQAVNMLEYAKPKDIELKEFKKQLQLLGCSFYASANESATTINIEGLDKNLEKSLKLMSNFLSNISVDESQLKKLAQDLKLDQKFEGKDVSTTSNALKEYALYGNTSKYISRLSLKQVKQLKPEQLLTKINEILSYNYEVHYCGTFASDAFNKTFAANFDINKELKTGKGKIEPTRQTISENNILFVNDSKAIQSHINFLIEGDVNDQQSRINMDGFNDYIDGNMGSIIFQEIREFRSLAYGSSGRYNSSFYLDKPGYYSGWLSTQADKTLDAVEAYTNILVNMPQKPERITEVQKNLTLSINAQQPRFRYKSLTVSSWLKQGYEKDPREIKFSDYQDMKFSQIMNFYNAYIKEKPWTITIVGDKKRIDLEALSKYGTIKEIKANDLFNK